MLFQIIGVKKGMIKKMYVDENDFRKKARSLKRYSIKSYKELIFEVLKGKNIEKKDGSYIKELEASECFKFLYGPPRIHYIIKDGSMIIEDLEPQDFLKEGYMRELKLYKGTFYRNSADKKKIDFYYKLKEKMKNE